MRITDIKLFYWLMLHSAPKMIHQQGYPDGSIEITIWGAMQYSSEYSILLEPQ